MKLDIIKNINADKLDYGIRRIGRNDISYLVMNEKTRLALATDGNMRVMSYMSTEGGTHSKYNDIPIAIYNALDFGEVDIVTEAERHAKV